MSLTLGIWMDFIWNSDFGVTDISSTYFLSPDWDTEIFWCLVHCSVPLTGSQLPKLLEISGWFVSSWGMDFRSLTFFHSSSDTSPTPIFVQSVKYAHDFVRPETLNYTVENQCYFYLMKRLTDWRTVLIDWNYYYRYFLHYLNHYILHPVLLSFNTCYYLLVMSDRVAYTDARVSA